MQRIHTINIKILLISAISLLLMSGCGSSGISSDTQLVHGAVQGEPLYEIQAHHESTAVVHSHAEPTASHEWTQVSGPAVALTTVTAPTTTFVVPATTPTPTQPVVLQHTTTHPSTLVTTVTQHTIIIVPPPAPAAPLDVLVGKPQVVVSGDIASLHASAFGGTAPYSYMWITPANITVDETHPHAPLFVAPNVSTTKVLTFGLEVIDADGNTATSNETITVSPPLAAKLDGPASADSGADITLQAQASGGTPPYGYQYTSTGFSTPIDATANPTITLPDVTTVTTVSIRLLVTDASTPIAIAQDSIDIQIHPVAAVPTVPPTDGQSCGQWFGEDDPRNVPCGRREMIPHPTNSSPCTADEPYHMNVIVQEPGQQADIFKTCANYNTCFHEWYVQSSGSKECWDYDPNIYPGDVYCRICCEGENCNQPLVPAENTLFKP